MSSIWVRGALVALCLVAAGPGEAQLAQETVAVHIMAMREALRAGDAARADAEGEAAWRLSEMQSGGSPDTAAIAYTLARMRVQAGAAQAALSPAERAYELAPASNNRVHVTNAAFVLGAAQMASGESAGVQTLRAALAQPAPGADGAMAHDAASLWAGDALAHARWQEVEQAADAALLYAAHARQGEALARGEALTWKGISLAYRRQAREASRSLAQALETLRPVAPETAPGATSVSAGERHFANAIAWYSAVSTMERGNPDRLDWEQVVAQPAPQGLAPLCPLSVALSARYQREPLDDATDDLLEREQRQGSQGAVVVRLRMGASGELISADIIASAPLGRFDAAALQMVQRYRFTRRMFSPPGCRMETAGRLIPIAFDSLSIP